MNKLIKKILSEIEKVLDGIDLKVAKELVSLIVDSKRVFLMGKGRSGLIANAFAMRLVHLGIESHFVGDPTSPQIRKNDLLIAISGSGKTKMTNDIISEVSRIGSKICLLTASDVKDLDLIIKFKAKTKYGGKSIQPMGSLFEDSVFLYLEWIVLLLMDQLGRKESYLKNGHTTLE